MFRPSDIIIDAFLEHLDNRYKSQFGKNDSIYAETLTQVARMALPRIASSNALYHNLEHTLLCTQAGIDIIRGKMIRDGDVSPKDWVNYISSLMCFPLGFVRDCCSGDQGDTCIINRSGDTITLPRGANDGALWVHFFERSKIFIHEHFENHPVLDEKVLIDNINHTEFPPPPKGKESTHDYPGLTRAAQVIGVVGDPKFMNKVKPLFLELQESGLASEMGYKKVSDIRESYPRAFWSIFHPLLQDAISYLKYTAEGLTWLANMHAHMLIEEHRKPAPEVVTPLPTNRNLRSK